jgi:pyruvyltransferase
MSKKALRLHWSRSKPNFGDALSPMICAHLYGGPIAYARIGHCDLVAQGSLLQRKKEGLLARRMVVWGTGLLEAAQPARSKHDYAAVRGCETRKCIRNIDPGVSLGDPGLLVHLLMRKPPGPKTHRIGLICHYKDKGDPTVARLCDRHPDMVEIDIFAPVERILRQIAACEVVFSSAMHGLIAADALGIPNAWIKLSDRVKGGDFKFHDYYSVFGLEAKPLVLDDGLVERQYRDIIDAYRREGLDVVQARLIESFPF